MLLLTMTTHLKGFRITEVKKIIPEAKHRQDNWIFDNFFNYSNKEMTFLLFSFWKSFMFSCYFSSFFLLTSKIL